MAAEILVIREKDSFSSILIEQGFSVTNFPTIKTEALKDLSELENCLEKIKSFDGVFITSSNAAEIFLSRIKEKRAGFSPKFYVLGKKSNDLIIEAGFETFFAENAATVEEMLTAIPQSEIEGKSFLFPCGNRSLRVIPESLKGVATVCEVVVYKTVATDSGEEQSNKIKEKLNNHEYAAVCFFSPSGVEGFLEKFPQFCQNKTKLAAIGTTTAKRAADKNLRVDFISAKPTADDFANGLAEYLRKEI